MIRRRIHFKRDAGWSAMAVGVAIQFVLLWGLIGKHPGPNYLLSVAAMLPIMFLLGLGPFIEDEGNKEWIPIVIGTLLIVGFLVGLVVAVRDQRDWRQQIVASDKAVEQIVQNHLEATNQKRGDLTILWGYGVPSRCYALRYANVYTEGAALRAEIDEICPNEWMYDVWGGYVELPLAYEPLVENDDWDVVILPERYIPEGIGRDVVVIYTEAETRGYGRVAVLLAP
jgi:hypothetical protein